MSYTTARRRDANSEANKLYPEDRAVHNWYRFVLSFPPHLVREYLQRFGLTSSQRVLDPFCGTGTTLVECKKRGIPSVGIEANPMAHLASRVKTEWMPDPAGLLEHARQVAQAASRQLAADGIEDNPMVSLAENRDLRLRGLPPEAQALLLTNSISPLPLHKTLVLLDCLQEQYDAHYQDHERVALAKALAYSISNLHFGPEVGVGPLKPDSPVIATWLAGVKAMAGDLEMMQNPTSQRDEQANRAVQPLRLFESPPEPDAWDDVPATVIRGDARQMLELVEPGSIDAVITSPPYPNEKDYTRTTRLESVLLGFISNKAELQALKRSLVRSNTRNVYKGDDDDEWVTGHPEIARLADAIEARRIELGKTSGFERLYARVTRLYFGGMARHLSDLRTILRPGAQLAYVVGDQASYLRIMIRTGQLLADIAQSLGYELVGIDLFRTRLATATKEQLREEVLVLRWPG